MYHHSEPGFGNLGGTTVLSFEAAIPAGPARFGRATPMASPGFQLATDLAVDIGSRTWWRGLATCVALCAATYALSPSLRPTARPAAIGADTWKAAPRQSIAPLPRRADVPDRVFPLTTTTGQVEGLTAAPERAGVDPGRMQRQSIAVDHTPLRIEGSVSKGVYISATDAGVPPKVVETYLRAIASQVDLGSLDPGARFDMIIERARAAAGEVQFGNLLYAGLTDGDRSTRMIQWTIDGRTQWYDAAGVGQHRAGFVMPVAGHQTSGFGMRFHPLLGFTRMHQGVDYGAAYGSPIYAATDGIVSFAGWHGGHGNMVRLTHMGGLGTGYAHMSRIAVAPGTRVSQGQVIGYVGSTGLSTGPHLHFEVYRNGGAVNPASVSFSTISLLSGSALTAFNTRLKQITSTR